MVTKSRSPGVFLLLFVMFQISVPGLRSIMWRKYTYIRLHYNWSQAQAYCRNSPNYDDLATIYTPSDLSIMPNPYIGAWIGLYNPNDGGNTSRSDWVWTSGNQNWMRDDVWANNEPHIHEKFYGGSCSGFIFFICYNEENGHHNYEFIPQSKTWFEARKYCKGKGLHLANFASSADFDRAIRWKDFPVWIGLHRDGETWKWSTGLSDYADEGWYLTYPDNNGNCASISSKEKLMVPQNCEDQFPFFCYRDNLVLIKEQKTWEEAVEYCMMIGYKLVSVQPGADHVYMMNMIEYEGGTEKVWTGLSFLAGHWLFMNGARVLYSDLPLCPVEEQRCGAFLRNDTASIHPTNCLEKWNFLCYQ